VIMLGQVDNVAAADAQRFQLHSSVEFWQNLSTRLNTRSIQNTEEEAQRRCGGVSLAVARRQGLLCMSAAARLHTVVVCLGHAWEQGGVPSTCLNTLCLFRMMRVQPAASRGADKRHP
jgi:hypothetical protein